MKRAEAEESPVMAGAMSASGHARLALILRIATGVLGSYLAMVFAALAVSRASDPTLGQMVGVLIFPAPVIWAFATHSLRKAVIGVGGAALITVLNFATSQASLPVTVPAGDWIIAGFDLTCCVLGIALLHTTRKVLNHRGRTPHASRQPQPGGTPVLQPAE